VPGETRELTTAERDLLGAMLDVESLEDAQSLRLQAASTRAAASCACGCGSIYLAANDARQAFDMVSLPVVEGDVVGDDGQVVGGLLLFVRDGRLHNLEVYSVTDDPLPLPLPERARLRRYHGNTQTP
jgi:hypothetical protein